MASVNLTAASWPSPQADSTTPVKYKNNGSSRNAGYFTESSFPCFRRESHWSRTSRRKPSSTTSSKKVAANAVWSAEIFLNDWLRKCVMPIYRKPDNIAISSSELPLELALILASGSRFPSGASEAMRNSRPVIVSRPANLHSNNFL